MPQMSNVIKGLHLNWININLIFMNTHGQQIKHKTKNTNLKMYDIKKS